MQNNSIRTISLFSGGGGLDIGFEEAGFQIMFATDFNHECCETLKMNKGNTLSKDLVVEECDSAKQKIRSSRVDRYYILTTSLHHEPTAEVLVEAENVKRLLGTQMIVNGVIPTIRYYLRLLSDPSTVLPEYVRLLQIDGAISFEHKDIWNKIATGIIE